MAPGLTFGDAGDLVIAAAQLGVPHPTGYPLYTLLAHAFLRIMPMGDPAWRLNLLSALCAAGTVVCLYGASRRLLQTRSAALFCAALFGVTPTFWGQATVTEVYALHMLLMTALLWGLLRHCEAGSAVRLGLPALLIGTMLAHHLMSVWLIPACIVFAILLARQSRGVLRVRASRLAAPLLLPLVLYLYLPAAALRDPAWNWGDPRTVERFVDHVTGRQFRERMGGEGAPNAWARLRTYFGLAGEGFEMSLTAQYPLAILPAVPLGLWSMGRRSRLASVLLVLMFVGPFAWATTYRIRDIEAYFMPCHLMACMWIATGWEEATLWTARRTGRGAARVAILLGCWAAAAVPAALAFARLPGQDRSMDRGAERAGRAYLAAFAPGSIVVLSGDTFAFPIAYRHYVMGQRPDLRLLLYADFLFPSHWRLVTRERGRGLIVPSPRSTVTGYSDPDLRFLGSVLDANRSRRTCYVVGDAFADMPVGSRIARVVGPVRRITPGLPAFRLLPRGGSTAPP